jgi:plasmid replication initiation protein
MNDGNDMMLSTAFAARAKATKGRPVRALQRLRAALQRASAQNRQACEGFFGPNSSTA